MFLQDEAYLRCKRCRLYILSHHAKGWQHSSWSLANVCQTFSPTKARKRTRAMQKMNLQVTHTYLYVACVRKEQTNAKKICWMRVGHTPRSALIVRLHLPTFARDIHLDHLVQRCLHMKNSSLIVRTMLYTCWIAESKCYSCLQSLSICHQLANTQVLRLCKSVRTQLVPTSKHVESNCDSTCPCHMGPAHRLCSEPFVYFAGPHLSLKSQETLHLAILMVSEIAAFPATHCLIPGYLILIVTVA